LATTEADKVLPTITSRCQRLEFHPISEEVIAAQLARIVKADGVTASTLYAEVPIDLKPQMGLIPLGMNPSTGLWEFYQQRGFKLPGQVGAANAALAHHDWVHLVAGYDTTPIGELEVTAFMAAASASPGAMLGFLGAVSIYETGLLQSVVLNQAYGRTLSDPTARERLATAIQRGARCSVDPLQGVDYFALADCPLSTIRTQWGIR
ncbi:MAG: hypothetical protein ACO3FK_06900, partial [Vulcanococcus sp.]